MNNQTKDRLFTESLQREIPPIKNATTLRRYVLTQEDNDALDEAYRLVTPPPGELAIGIEAVVVDSRGRSRFGLTGKSVVYYTPEG
jgi:hypothetical protein